MTFRGNPMLPILIRVLHFLLCTFGFWRIPIIPNCDCILPKPPQALQIPYSPFDVLAAGIICAIWNGFLMTFRETRCCQYQEFSTFCCALLAFGAFQSFRIVTAFYLNLRKRFKFLIPPLTSFIHPVRPDTRISYPIADSGTLKKKVQ
jgi:hypothetical protein